MAANEELNELEKRMMRENVKAVRITNNDLKCKDCKYRRDDSIIEGNTSRCDIYPVSKPNKVINGGDCSYYDKGEENEY